MSTHHEREVKDTKVDSKHVSTNNEADAAVAEPKNKKLQLIISKIGHYLLLGLVPIISVCALCVAVYNVNRSQSQNELLVKSNAQVEVLNASLVALRLELAKLKASASQDKQQQDDVTKNEEGRINKIIQNITPLQKKLKISPTIEDQFKLAEIASGVQVGSVSAVLPTPSKATIDESPISVQHADKKQKAQVKAMKDAIEKYNKAN